MNNTLNIKLGPSYVEEREGERVFQRDMIEFTENRDGKVLILDAPTGAGKTTAFKKLNTLGTVLIVLPNRLLQEEVAREIKKANFSFSEINKDSIDNLSKVSDERRVDAVKEMLTGKDFIITNPVILLNILLNLYGSKNLGPDKFKNLSSFLLKQGIKVIVFDEFHVYDYEQIIIVMAVNILLSNNIKFVYSSATPQVAVINFFQKYLPDINIREKKVLRITTGTGKPIQGPLNITLINDLEAIEFIKQNINIFKKDNWLIILDRIVDIDECYRSLVSGGIKKEDIILISGYHGKSLNFVNRIVIASNIIEQGINPPNQYDHILIDSGRSVKNIAQRVGRIGRGNEKISEVYICLGIHLALKKEDFEPINIIDDLFDKLSPYFNQNNYVISPYFVGVYLAIISYVNGIENIVSKFIKNYPSIKAGFEDFNWINSIFNGKSDSAVAKDLRKNSTLENISEWWKIFNTTFGKFLLPTNKVKGIDENIDPDEPINIEYDELWIRRNKIFEFNNGVYKITGNLDKPDNDFDVSVKGLPFKKECHPLKYNDWRYDYKNQLIKYFKQGKDLFEYTSNSFDSFDKLFDKLKKIINATASPNRLIICKEK